MATKKMARRLFAVKNGLRDFGKYLHLMIRTVFRGAFWILDVLAVIAIVIGWNVSKAPVVVILTVLSLLLLASGFSVWRSTKMAIEVADQKQHEKRPYLQVDWSKQGGEILRITNSGGSLARDVFVEPIDLGGGIIFFPNGRSVLESGARAVISVHEIQKRAHKNEVSGYGDYLTNIKPILDQRLEEGGVGMLHITYLDKDNNAYDAVFKPREDLEGRFAIESQHMRRK